MNVDEIKDTDTVAIAGIAFFKNGYAIYVNKMISKIQNEDESKTVLLNAFSNFELIFIINPSLIYIRVTL